ncbi:uncharacterized protein [Arachis hypogaea]|uniref:uncharacterized protein n=1 Tax=Arachis hypogaea TaxID=3818 RepID=UPI003B2230BD
MPKLSYLEFNALDISGNNYLSWILDAEIHLDSMDLGDTIKAKNNASQKDKAKAMIFLRRHLDEGLKNEYLTLKDLADFWKDLEERYNHKKMVILPQARYELTHLRLQDFKSINEYNSAIFRITPRMKLCGKKITDNDMLEKTFSTFHASNVLLQQQYREKGFKKYSELISYLFVAERNNKLLLRNHEARPTGATPFPEVNAGNHYPKRGKWQGFSNKKNYGRKRNYVYKRGSHQKWDKERNYGQNKSAEDKCFRCGGKGYWSRTCRTPKHLVDLYQAYLKMDDKEKETNFVSNDVEKSTTHYDVSDFFEDPEGNIGHLINDGIV